MAVIQCVECGGKVSSKAAACPHCGAPVIAPSVTEPESVKSRCQSCDEHIEHPLEMLGQTIECPHCHRVTVLTTDPEGQTTRQEQDAAEVPTKSAPVSDQAGAAQKEAYVVLINQQVAGPFAIEELKTLVQEQKINRATLCERLGASHWQSLATILPTESARQMPSLIPGVEDDQEIPRERQARPKARTSQQRVNWTPLLMGMLLIVIMWGMGTSGAFDPLLRWGNAIITPNPDIDGLSGEDLKYHAERGYAPAQVKLGQSLRDHAFAKSVGLDMNPSGVSEAAQWFRKAAEQGNVYAEYEMYSCCRSGSGVPKDEIEAYKWLTLAVAQRYPKAMEELKEWDSRELLKLNDADRKEALRRASEFVPKRSSSR